MIRNQAGSKPVPAAQAAALAGIVAAGNIAGEMGVNPDLLNAAAAIAAQAAGIQVKSDPKQNSPSASAARPSSLQIKEEPESLRAEVVAQARAIGASAEIRGGLGSQQVGSQDSSSQRHGAAKSRSNSF